MWALGLLLSRHAKQYFMPVAAALVAVAIVAMGWLYMKALHARIEAANNAALLAQQQAAMTRKALDSVTLRIQAMQAAEAARIAAQQDIERSTHARRQRNSAIMARPENAEVADIVLPPDMLDGMRAQ